MNKANVYFTLLEFSLSQTESNDKALSDPWIVIKDNSKEVLVS